MSRSNGIGEGDKQQVTTCRYNYSIPVVKTLSITLSDSVSGLVGFGANDDKSTHTGFVMHLYPGNPSISGQYASIL
ncbi:MAG: hypothetical protein GY839_07615 [candidate division Zixibacteria bacterium]|nr:hypothetical protein [candidate division Zixibacteria bacterium]